MAHLVRPLPPHAGLFAVCYCTHGTAAVPPRRRRGYLEVMLDRVFGESALHLNAKLEAAADSGALPLPLFPDCCTSPLHHLLPCPR